MVIKINIFFSFLSFHISNPAYRNKYPIDAFIIYPDKKGYIGINAYDWLRR